MPPKAEMMEPEVKLREIQLEMNDLTKLYSDSCKEQQEIAQKEINEKYMEMKDIELGTIFLVHMKI